MKRIKKFASLLLAMVMVLATTITSAAAPGDNPNTAVDGPYEIKIIGSTADHKYEAYKIFAGEIATKEENNATIKVLSNIEWGSGVDAETGHTHTDACYDKAKSEDPSQTRTLICGIEAGKTLVQALADANIKGKINGVDKSITVNMTAKEVAEILAGIANDTEQIQKFSDIVGRYLTTDKYDLTGEIKEVDNTKSYEYTINVNEPGYYFIKDRDGSVSTDPVSDPSDKIATYTDYILQVVGPTEVHSKDTTLTWEKKILTTSGISPNATVVEADANKVGVGGKVTYQLKTMVPDTSRYTYYYLVMEDALSGGLDFNNDITVTLKRGTTETKLTRGTDYHVYEVSEVDGKTVETEVEDHVHSEDCYDADRKLTCKKDLAKIKTFKIAFTDIMDSKYAKDDVIIATYTATVNDSAASSVEGEPNKFRLNYSQNPNYPYPRPGDDKPGLPNSTIDMPIGKTPYDTVVTYVARLRLTKIQNGNTNMPLAGAEFTLTGVSADVVLKGGTQYVRDDENGTWYQLAADEKGTISYTETAPQTVASMEKAKDGATKGYVKAEPGYSGGDKETIKGEVYRPYQPEKDAGKEIFIKVEPNNSAYASTTMKFSKKENVTQNVVTTKVVHCVAESDADGSVIFRDKATGKEISIGEGEFTITETKTPAGFNTIDPLKLITVGTVKDKNGKAIDEKTGIVSGEETCTWEVGKGSSQDITVTPSKDVFNVGGGVYTAYVNNQSGSILPSTGGIGTTIFYVIGGILVIGAGILLVTKKRMGSR